ncbi:SAM-dependent methyltransferase [Pseudonocardia aurantiaca]|uniref:SAM-dependent methyltransferase n=1 Tax=Pseudonocardia aurantiaca TaxID=75290 RepID=A0ABW4FVZ0_9PSEU
MGDHEQGMSYGDDENTHAPADVDLSRPSIARVYDFLLGGKENLEIDRRAANRFLNVVPEAAQIARDNREFLRRALRFLVGEAGIRQVIDVGSGLPTAGNVHELAHEIAPDVRVVYVDNDPVVLAHGRALLDRDQITTIIRADLRKPETIFEHEDSTKLIDFSQPYAMLLGGILHHLFDKEDPYGATAHIVERLVPGSYLLVSNFLDDDEPRAKAAERAFMDSGLRRGRFRTWAEQRRFFEGLELVEPGFVYVNDWRPDERTSTEDAVRTLHAGGIGRKV